MATLIAHSPESTTLAFAQRVANTLGAQRGVTTAVEDFGRAGRYVDNVDAVIVIAPAEQQTFHRGARNFLAAHAAELAEKSLFIVGLGTAPKLTETQQAAMEAFAPRDTAYFRVDALDDAAFDTWIGFIHSRGAA